MSHYAKVIDGKVVQVISAEEDFFDSFMDSSPGHWIKTSYNTRGGEHYDPQTGEINTSEKTPALRGNYAGVGYIYDFQNDVFYAPKPFESWTLNTSTWQWQAPTPMPDDGKIYYWDENTLSWLLISSDL
jgi:hypothetical protein